MTKPSIDEESLEETPLICDRTDRTNVFHDRKQSKLISIDPRKSKTSYAYQSMMYAATIAMILSFFCFTIAYTVSTPRNYNPIEMEEEGKFSPVGYDNGNIMNRHEHGDDDYTSEYHPYYHTLVDKDLWMSGKKGEKYHIKFFEKADISMWKKDWSYSAIDIGHFRGVDPDGNIILSNGTFCEEVKRERYGVINFQYGPSIQLIKVDEPEKCYYELTVSSPEEPSFSPTQSPSASPKIDLEPSSTKADEVTGCDEGYYKNSKGRCTKLAKEYSKKGKKTSSATVQ